LVKIDQHNVLDFRVVGWPAFERAGEVADMVTAGVVASAFLDKVGGDLFTLRWVRDLGH
jgi:hypothetical protein